MNYLITLSVWMHDSDCLLSSLSLVMSWTFYDEISYLMDIKPCVLMYNSKYVEMNKMNTLSFRICEDLEHSIASVMSSTI
jgi:CTP:phosphocholine cytidylyltransferase-like protein